MTQAFVYKWIHKPTGMWYIGSRTAEGCHINDGYICSSTTVKPMIEQNPDEWERSILHTGMPKEMRKMETRLLTESNAMNNLMSFNRNNADGPPNKRKRTMETPMKNNQIDQTPKKGRGGKRANSGRKLGATQKLSATSLLDAIAQADVPFEQGIAEDYHKARLSGDLYVIQKYQNMILNKVISDKQALDVTSNGETMQVQLVFTPVELPDWKSNTPL